MNGRSVICLLNASSMWLLTVFILQEAPVTYLPPSSIVSLQRLQGLSSRCEVWELLSDSLVESFGSLFARLAVILHPNSERVEGRCHQLFPRLGPIVSKYRSDLISKP